MSRRSEPKGRRTHPGMRGPQRRSRAHRRTEGREDDLSRVIAGHQKAGMSTTSDSRARVSAAAPRSRGTHSTKDALHEAAQEDEPQQPPDHQPAPLRRHAFQGVGRPRLPLVPLIFITIARGHGQDSIPGEARMGQRPVAGPSTPGAQVEVRSSPSIDRPQLRDTGSGTRTASTPPVASHCAGPGAVRPRRRRWLPGPRGPCRQGTRR